MVLDNDNIPYSVNLTTGQATALGKFPAGSVITDLTASNDGTVAPARGAVAYPPNRKPRPCDMFTTLF
jgi:hypothetical protein